MKWNLDLYMQSVSGRQQAPNELNRMPDLGGDNNQSTGNSNSGTDPILPYVLNGPNVVTPVDEFTGNQVSGTIVVNEPIRVQMTTNGGNSNISITNTIISFQRGTVPTNSPLSREAYVTRGNVVTSTP
mgnify:FL=1